MWVIRKVDPLGQHWYYHLREGLPNLKWDGQLREATLFEHFGDAQTYAKLLRAEDHSVMSRSITVVELDKAIQTAQHYDERWSSLCR